MPGIGQQEHAGKTSGGAVRSEGTGPVAARQGMAGNAALSELAGTLDGAERVSELADMAIETASSTDRLDGQEHPTGEENQTEEADDRKKRKRTNTKKEAGNEEKKAKPAEAFKEALRRELTSRGWVQWGKTRSEVWFKPIPGDADAEGGYDTNIFKGELPRKNRGNEIHAGSGSVVSSSSFRGRRSKQALRWLSTVAMRYLTLADADPREVQAARVEDDEILMATNTNKGNEALTEALAAGANGMGAFMKMIGEIEAKVEGSKGTIKLTNRERRHIRKLLDRYGGENPPDAGIATALRKPILAVQKKANARDDGLHAERRIALELNVETLSANEVGGVKRPCVTCALKVFQGETVHAGPFWISNAANCGVDHFTNGNFTEQDVKDTADWLDQMAGTYVSLTNNSHGRNAITKDNDSDSDSGAES